MTLKYVLFKDTEYYPSVVGEFASLKDALDEFEIQNSWLIQDDNLFLCNIMKKVVKKTGGNKK